jgi:signal transduction histidine kinase
MVRECDRLSQMVERVLFFVRFDQGALLLRPEEQVEPGEWLRAVEEVFRARYRLDGAGSEAPAGNDTARFRVEVEDGLPPVAMDRGAMTQALLNLLDNAWKYSFGARQAEEGGAGRDRITLAARRGTAARFPWGRRAGVLLTVRDTGIGIARRDLRRVFRKYYRGELAQHRNVSGVGLGLPFCRFVVRGHGGWIRVRSEPGQGTEFTVFLPAGGGS